ncbi:MAG: cysteine-rich CWC family protein [Gammaproteobacteria bacterium]|jgi:hypothetical protein
MAHKIKPKTKHEIKRCPRCHLEFECKSGSVLLCQCQTIPLSAEQLDYVNAKYEDCLCASCLEELRAEFINIENDINRLTKK